MRTREQKDLAILASDFHKGDVGCCWLMEAAPLGRAALSLLPYVCPYGHPKENVRIRLLFCNLEYMGELLKFQG